MTQDATVTVGLDLGDRFAQLHALDASGTTLEESRLPMTREALTRRFDTRDRQRVVLEVGPQSRWVSQVLIELDHEVYIANPRKTRLIGCADNKSDRVDAEMLARLGRADPKLLFPVRHRGQRVQQALAVVRARRLAVESRTALVSHCRGVAKAFGHRLPQCSTAVFHRILDDVPDELRGVFEPLLAAIAQLTATIKEYDREVRRLADEFPETALLQQVDGVGPLIALTFVLTIEDPRRFDHRQVGAYLGLCPGRHQSGGADPQRRITKAGDVYLRQLLVQSAHRILGHFGKDSDLRRWGLGLVDRGGRHAKGKALVAVARKLATLLHTLWTTGATYEPLRNSNHEPSADSSSGDAAHG